MRQLKVGKDLCNILMEMAVHHSTQAQVQSGSSHEIGQQDPSTILSENSVPNDSNALQKYIAPDFWEALSKEVSFQVAGTSNGNAHSDYRRTAFVRYWRNLTVKTHLATSQPIRQCLRLSRVIALGRSCSTMVLQVCPASLHSLSLAR